jgi:hypothetical protein
MGWCEEEVESKYPTSISDTLASDERAHGRVGQPRVHLRQVRHHSADSRPQRCVVPPPYRNNDDAVALPCMLLQSLRTMCW